VRARSDHGRDTLEGLASEAGNARHGWRKLPNGKWEQVPKEDPLPPTPVDMTGVDVSLDASHKRITDALAVHTRRLELAAAGGTTTSGLDALAQLAGIWRTLEANIEKAAERVIEKAVKRELARLGPNEQPEDGHGTAEAGNDGDGSAARRSDVRVHGRRGLGDGSEDPEAT
jgi:hypothetical protein